MGNVDKPLTPTHGVSFELLRELLGSGPVAATAATVLSLAAEVGVFDPIEFILDENLAA